MRWVLKRVRVFHLPVKTAKETGNIDHFARKRYVLIMPAVEFTAEPDEKPVAGAAHEEKGQNLRVRRGGRTTRVGNRFKGAPMTRELFQSTW
jgi:hypothetical protein